MEKAVGRMRQHSPDPNYADDPDVIAIETFSVREDDVVVELREAVSRLKLRDPIVRRWPEKFEVLYQRPRKKLDEARTGKTAAGTTITRRTDTRAATTATRPTSSAARRPSGGRGDREEWVQWLSTR